MDALGSLSPLIETLLDASTVRQRVVAENLANAETPGYRAKTVRFDAALERAVAAGDYEAARDARPAIVEREGRLNANGNDVNVDTEIGEMNRNALAYQTLLSVALMKKSQMRSAVTGRSA
jgi:flagellar basal-body rod protein FlgB